MSELRTRLRDGPATVLDGGLGSMLLDRGLEPGMAPERWNLERARDIVAVHRAYVEAGSDAVHTNTFGGTPIRLAAFGLADRCDEINRAAVALARQAGARFVFGDVGPTGEYLPPVGEGDPEAWHASFVAQGSALVVAGVDALHVETMSDLREATIALDALRGVAPDLPVLISLTFERKRRGFFTVMGDRPVDAFEALARRGADAVGANCSITSTDMRDLVTEVAASDPPLEVPLVFQPNAGKPRVDGDKVCYDQSPDDFAEDLVAMVDTGVRVLGGCCGTDPRFITALRARLWDKWV